MPKDMIFKIKAVLALIVKIKANFPQQKPFVTKTHSPLKEKKHGKIYKYFVENHKTTCVRTSI